MEIEPVAIVGKVSGLPSNEQSMMPNCGDKANERPSERVDSVSDTRNGQSQEGLDHLGDLLRDYLQTQGSQIVFRVDNESGRLVTEVRDSTTGELLRQIPPEETLRAAVAVHEYLGLIINTRY